jgi:PII-like signaling protein
VRLRLICLGGALGTAARYLVGGLAARWLGADVPNGTLIEVVDSQEHLDRVLPEVDEMMRGGLITTERVRVLRYEEPRGR